jgi:hypothetical protein
VTSLKIFNKNTSQPSPKIEDDTELENTEDEITILKLEKEIVIYALNHIQQAETKDKINPDVTAFLKNKYSAQKQHLEKLINKKSMLVKLHKLEDKKDDLLKMFQNKLDEVNESIERIQEDLDKF